MKKAKGMLTYKNVSKAKKLKKFKGNANNGTITVPNVTLHTNRNGNRNIAD